MAEARLDFKLYGNVKSLDGGRSVDRESSDGFFAAIGSPLITSGIHEFEFRVTAKGVPSYTYCGLIGADVAPEEAEAWGFNLGSGSLYAVPKGDNPTTSYGSVVGFHPDGGIRKDGSLTVIANMDTPKVSFQKGGGAPFVLPGVTLPAAVRPWVCLGDAGYPVVLAAYRNLSAQVPTCRLRLSRLARPPHIPPAALHPHAPARPPPPPLLSTLATGCAAWGSRRWVGARGGARVERLCGRGGWE